MAGIQNAIDEEDKRVEALGAANLVTFTLYELATYTKEFTSRIAIGGFGTVYKGMISGRDEEDLNGKHIVVKASHDVISKFRKQWQSEIMYLPRFDHPNIIKLIGKCETTTRLFLVYPFINNGSVHSNLSGLNWSRSLGIMRGAARAMQQLHSQSPPLIFNDFKSENILLDENWNPLLCDFGTVVPEGQPSYGGSIGYSHPLTILRGYGSKATDIFSLGVLILQLIMKREIVVDPKDVEEDPHGTTIRTWASKIYREKGDVVHDCLKRRGCKREEAAAITQLGLQCTDLDESARPTVEEVLETLSGLSRSRSLLDCTWFPCKPSSNK